MRKSITLLLTILFVFSLSSCKKAVPENCSYVEDTNIVTCTEQYLQYFDTLITLTVYYDDSKTTEELELIYFEVDDILNTYHMVSDKYNSYDGITNIYTINQSPSETHIISSELFTMIEYSLDKQVEVNNLFNIALGPVLNHWHDYRESCDIFIDDVSCTLPSVEDLNESSKYINSDDVILDTDNQSITLKENMSLDVGGVAKGYVSDKLSEYLDGAGLTGYIINNGLSNISIGGTHPYRENGEFLIGITDPVETLSTYLYLYVSGDDQVVTSGDYQQYGITDGKRYHHIIDPTTLYPSNYSHSVTLITKDAALGDIYSTALFNMSIEDGIVFVDSIDDLEAVWYGLDDLTYYSEKFEALYTKK